ncbi:MAG: ribosome-associated translation inhibitor RaiA [Acidimicrobiia bacterium]|nr:ribosome-associated translation inhibitor RaiA [Acidimicrobiia bacterium]
MEVRINGRGIRLTDETRAHVVGRVNRTAKFFDRLGDVHVNLTRVRSHDSDHRFRAELSARAAGHLVRASGEGDTVRRSVDTASDHFERRLRRLSQKLSDRRRHRPKPDARAGGRRRRSDRPDDRHKSISRVRRPVGKPMTPEEAAIVMEENGDTVVLFSNVETGDLNVLHRSAGGWLELIEPE